MAGYLALELDLLVVAVRCVPLGKPGLSPEIRMRQLSCASRPARSWEAGRLTGGFV